MAAKLAVPAAHAAVAADAVMSVPGRYWAYTTHVRRDRQPHRGLVGGLDAGGRCSRGDRRPGDDGSAEIPQLWPELELDATGAPVTTWLDDPVDAGRVFRAGGRDENEPVARSATPVGRIVFAGEHTSPDWSGTIEGRPPKRRARSDRCTTSHCERRSGWDEMTERTGETGPTHRAGAYGWQDFDQEVVEGLVENDARFINRHAGGWIASPLLGHYDNKLAWKDDNFKKGSVPVGNPPVSFRAAPTYVLERPLDNAIAGHELIADAVAGKWGNPEATRFGNENSEGALTWNVFRTLQEAGRLAVAAGSLAGHEPTEEPELYFWGRRVTTDAATAWDELAAILLGLEPGATQHVEPDVCLHVAGFGWVVIEASFGPSFDAFDDAGQVEELLGLYAAACPGLFAEERIRTTRLRDVPRLLLRALAIAHSLRMDGERAVVVALVRESDTADVERRIDRCLAGTADVGFRRVTWESLYRALDPADPTLGPLRDYLERKSFGLRPAFAIHGAEETDDLD